ncbi:hypothetical protein D3C86_1700780 [compost metagenome]
MQNIRQIGKTFNNLSGTSPTRLSNSIRFCFGAHKKSKITSKKSRFLTISFTTKDLSALAVRLVLELFSRERISAPEDGGGKTLAKKNADCTFTNNN